jgi:hypothetical protein
MTHRSPAYLIGGESIAAPDTRRLTFKELIGDPAYLCAQTNANGQERFNFAQRVTLHPGVTMRTRPHWCPELETLAVNLLLHSKPAWRSVRTATAARRMTKPYAEAFAAECLAPFAGHTWVLTTESVLDTLSYLDSRARSRPRARTLSIGAQI